MNKKLLRLLILPALLLAVIAALGATNAFPASHTSQAQAAGSGNTVYQWYDNPFDEVSGTVPLRWGTDTWGYNHIKKRVQEDPAHHVDDFGDTGRGTMSSIINDIMASNTTRKCPGRSSTSYELVNDDVGFSGNERWVIVIGEDDGFPGQGDERGIITVYQDTSNSSCPSGD